MSADGVKVGATTAGDAAFLACIKEIADSVSAPNADAVDREARFPQETIDALRQINALSALVPVELGGEGASFEAVASACFELGRRCGASAMVFAMHQIQVACMVRHLDGSPWFAKYLERLSRQQRLVASVTSEVGTGGDMGSSVAALRTADEPLTPTRESLTPVGEGLTPVGEDLTPVGEDLTPVGEDLTPVGEGLTPVGEGLTPPRDMLTFEKQAPTVSYGAHADDLFVTLRRSPEAERSDQVIALVQSGQAELEQTGSWDPLGMRGTCSPGYVVRATLPSEQVLATPFSEVSSESMVPISHVLWSQLWLGIATDAFDRARAFVKVSAKRSPGELPPSAQRLSHLLSELSLLRGEVGSGLADFMEMSQEPGRPRLSTMTAALRFNNLKIAASEQAPRVCEGALGVCGIMGFKNDTPFSVGRHLRDTMSACLMIANERIHKTNASLLLIAKDV